MKSPVKLLLIQLLIIPMVIFIFKMPAEKRVLSLIANGVFLTVSFLTILYRGIYQNWVRIVGLQFLITAVLPITILRIISWDTDFNQSTFLGVLGSQWHAYSNISFMVMLIGTLIVVIRSRMYSVQ